MTRHYSYPPQTGIIRIALHWQKRKPTEGQPESDHYLAVKKEKGDRAPSSRGERGQEQKSERGVRSAGASAWRT